MVRSSVAGGASGVQVVVFSGGISRSRSCFVSGKTTTAILGGKGSREDGALPGCLPWNPETGARVYLQC